MIGNWKITPPQLPYLEIWLEPVCDACVAGAEITWCPDNVYEPCPKCGRKATRYRLDRRQKRLDPPRGANP